eukprot:6495118-Pyramimonas_sp.AAC.1
MCIRDRVPPVRGRGCPPRAPRPWPRFRRRCPPPPRGVGGGRGPTPVRDRRNPDRRRRPGWGRSQGRTLRCAPPAVASTGDDRSGDAVRDVARNGTGGINRGWPIRIQGGIKSRSILKCPTGGVIGGAIQK